MISDCEIFGNFIETTYLEDVDDVVQHDITAEQLLPVKSQFRPLLLELDHTHQTWTLTPHIVLYHIFGPRSPAYPRSFDSAAIRAASLTSSSSARTTGFSRSPLAWRFARTWIHSSHRSSCQLSAYMLPHMWGENVEGVSYRTTGKPSGRLGKEEHGGSKNKTRDGLHAPSDAECGRAGDGDGAAIRDEIHCTGQY